MEYNPWKFILMLPLMVLLEALHVICCFFEMIDDNIVCPAGERIEEWLDD